MKIAIVSLDQSWEDKESNKEKCRTLSAKVKKLDNQVELIIYPELTLTGFSILNKDLIEQEDQAETIRFFRQLSEIHNTIHMFGVAVKSYDGLNYNKLLAVDERGNMLANYSKMHTFSLARESELFATGNYPEILKLKDGRIGCSICFDLRFSQLYNHYRDNCNAIVNIANWPAKRIQHWEILLRARAIENQLFMIGVNRTGTDGNEILYSSSSFVFDPLGNKLSPVKICDDISIYCIDFSEVNLVRDAFPFAQDLRTDLYPKL